jgi:antirestriction protein ArdC
MSKKFDIYENVTNRLLEALERGTRPWSRPWRTVPGEGVPRNAVSGRPYHGINVMLLWGASQLRGFSSQRWLTYRQARTAGGHVRHGEKGELIVFWRFLERERQRERHDDDGRPVLDEDGLPRKEIIPLARGYTVFNVEQCEDLPESVSGGRETDPEWDPVPGAEAFIAATGADIRHGGNRAFYAPHADRIQMPPRGRFDQVDGYYDTLLHELTHWTGHESRLGRQFDRFGSEAYALEELVAELGAAFLCARLGLASEPREDHAGYINGWLRVLKRDKKAIFSAASAARSALEYLESLQVEEREELAAA